MSIDSVSVLGLGHWGTALLNHLGRRGFNALGWSRNRDIVSSINSERRNCKYFPDIQLTQGVRATTSLTEAAAAKLIVVATPSAGLPELAQGLSCTPETIVVSGVKGIEKESLLTPLDFFEGRLSAKPSLAVISGPSFAKDVIAERPCSVVAASRREDIARQVAEIFSGNGMRVYFSQDVIGVELGGILKNVIALAAGVADGLELGDSARVGLITRGLAEMTRLATALGADRRTLSGLSGLGDLTMTATCDTSRNRTVGLRLGRGEKLEEIVNTLGSVAEGVSSAPRILAMVKKRNLEAPITEAVVALLEGKSSTHEIMKRLIMRPVKREFE